MSTEYMTALQDDTQNGYFGLYCDVANRKATEAVSNAVAASSNADQAFAAAWPNVRTISPEAGDTDVREHVWAACVNAFGVHA